MIRLVYEGLIYSALLVNCYDGDTCHVRFDDVPPFLREQRLRFTGIDTPEIRGKCPQEKALAQRARAMTHAYIVDGGAVFLVNGRDQKGRHRFHRLRGKYGRLLVNAPDLNAQLIEEGLARPSVRGERTSWC